MFAGFCFILIIFAIPETYGPKLLVNKAKKIRKETGDDAYWAPRASRVSNWSVASLIW